MATRLSTGIEKLDRALNGGVREGSVISITAPPNSQYEIFLQHFIKERDTLYISTTRTEEHINKQLSLRGIDRNGCGVKYVDPTDSVMEDVLNYAKKPPRGSNVIIDISDPLESEDTGRIINFFHELKTHMETIGGIALVVGLNSEPVPSGRKYTYKMADIVMDIEFIHRGTETEIMMRTPKNRNETAVIDPLKLLITDNVEVDSKRQVG